MCFVHKHQSITIDMTKKEQAILESLVNRIRGYEDECFREIAFCNTHKFELEREAIRYKQQAYNRCWLEVSNTIDKLKNID